MTKVTDIKPAPAKSARDQFMEGLVLVMIAAFLLWCIEKVFNFLFSSFVPLDWAKVAAKIEEDFNSRIARRAFRQERFAAQYRDPMHQFQERFILYPEDYRDDPDNERYYGWYRDWKAGRILDTFLRWTPPMYDDEGMIKANFLDYVAMQKKLHQGTSRGYLFLLTIRTYFPEFTPTWRGLEEDLAGYRVEAHHRLVLQNTDLPQSYLAEAEGLVSEGARLDQDLAFLKRCAEAGYDVATAMTMLENKVEPCTPEVEIIQQVLFTMRLPRKACGILLRHELTAEEMAQVAHDYDNARSLYGLDFYRTREGDTASVNEQIFDTYVQDALVARRVKKIERVCGATKKGFDRSIQPDV